MKKYQPTVEHAVYGVILLIAILLRFLHISAVSLSDFESTWALQALQISQGLHPAISTNPAYVHLTAIVFYVFKASDFMARFWPAVMGSVLVVSPWLLRKTFGRLLSLILAFGLAIDPGMVAMSHLAGGPMLAVSFLVLTVFMWLKQKYQLVGIFLGMAMLSGQSFWFGLLGLTVSVLIYNWLPKKWSGKQEEDSQKLVIPENRKDIRNALFWCAGTLLLVGSLFTFSLKGLPALVSSLWGSIQGWWQFSGIPIRQILILIPAYEILPLAFGILGFIRGVKNKNREIFILGLWVLTSFLLTIAYPAKNPQLMVWTILPLWILAAFEWKHHFDFTGRNVWEVAGVIVFITSILIFAWLNLAGLTNIDLFSSLGKARILMLAIVVILVGLALLLIGTGWSTALARLGGVWSFGIVLTAFTLAMSTGAGEIRRPLTAELWYPEPRSGRLDILLNVANTISDLNRGAQASFPMTLVKVNSPSLSWLFRDWELVTSDFLAPDATPPLIITPQGDISLTVNYRGEALVLDERIDWESTDAAGWLKWFIYRQMPVQQEDVILWVRNDLLLDNQNISVTKN